MCSLRESQGHNTASSSHPTDPHSRSPLHSNSSGPGRPSDGHTHDMTMIDRSTRWVEGVPLNSTTVSACADALVSVWISRFGVPAAITTDRGIQFTSAVRDVLCKRLGIQHITTTTYNPQSNGMVEHFHQQLKDAFQARLAVRESLSHLPWVLAAPKEDHNVSAGELLYGVHLALPGELLNTAEPPAASFLENLHRLPISLPNRPLSGLPRAPTPPSALSSADFLFFKRGAPGPPLSLL